LFYAILDKIKIGAMMKKPENIILWYSSIYIFIGMKSMRAITVVVICLLSCVVILIAFGILSERMIIREMAVVGGLAVLFSAISLAAGVSKSKTGVG